MSAISSQWLSLVSTKGMNLEKTCLYLQTKKAQITLINAYMISVVCRLNSIIAQAFFLFVFLLATYYNYYEDDFYFCFLLKRVRKA